MVNFWGFFLTLVLYIALKNFKKIPPMVTTGLFIIGILKITGISYDSYNESACFYTLMLGPATIALGYPLIENKELLLRNKRAIYFGFMVAALTALLSTWLLGKIFKSDLNIISSLLPKSVTTPIAVEISKTIGGIPELTACIVVVTGVFGALFGHKILKLFKIKSDIAIGLAIGASSHVMGTSSCIGKKRKLQVVMATLALIIIGLLTTLLCTLCFG